MAFTLFIPSTGDWEQVHLLNMKTLGKSAEFLDVIQGDIPENLVDHLVDLQTKARTCMGLRRSCVEGRWS